MSQAGELNPINSNPQIPTTFITDDGNAIPIANELEIFGAVVPNSGTPVETTGSGNTLTLNVQISDAIASSNINSVGLCAFDSGDFTVDADGFVTLNGGGGGAVMSVSGTANRITSTGGANPIIDIALNYSGQTSITSLGTITTGTWNADSIGPAFGGTGLNSYSTGDILFASAANTLSTLSAGTNGDVLTLAAGIPSWSTPTSGTVTSVSGTADRITISGTAADPVVDIAATYVGQSSITTLGTITTGTWNGSVIPLTYGGTNANLTASNGGIFYSTATAGAILSGTATAGQIIRSGSSSAPSWSTATYPDTAGTSGNVLTSDGTNWTSSAPAGGDLVLIQAQTASSSSTIDFTSGGGASGIGSTYYKLLLSFKGVQGSVDGAQLRMQMSNDGGSSWITTGYTAGMTYTQYNSITNNNINSTTAFVLSGTIDNSATTRLGAGDVNIYLTSSNDMYISGTVCYLNNTGPFLANGLICGRGGATGANAFRLIMDSGNIATGRFYLYGYAES